jgi:hypothetical protein
MTEAAEFIEAWRAVANAKLIEYRRQCWHLAGLVRAGAASKVDAVDKLWEIATAHALVRALGEDHVELIIAEAFLALTTEAAA